MSEIYWLTRLDAIQGVAIAFAIVFGTLALVAWITHWTTLSYDPDGAYEPEIKFSNSTRWPAFITALITITLAVFIPNKKDMLMIWGIGGTIEYVQENETLQGLPDKCVQALDAWVDSWTEDKKTENSTE